MQPFQFYPVPPPERRVPKLQPTTRMIGRCPECGGLLVRSSGCLNCTQCGWGLCG
jgi:hypothetical protein